MFQVRILLPPVDLFLSTFEYHNIIYKDKTITKTSNLNTKQINRNKQLNIYCGIILFVEVNVRG